jgi:hypothetical protein
MFVFGARLHVQLYIAVSNYDAQLLAAVCRMNSEISCAHNGKPYFLSVRINFKKVEVYAVRERPFCVDRETFALIMCVGGLNCKNFAAMKRVYLQDLLTVYRVIILRICHDQVV